MALIRTFNLSIPVSLTKCNPTNLARRYSVFPSRYVEPIYRKDEQEELYKTAEGKQMAHMPIKPAFTGDTSSEFHDALTRKFTNYVMKKGKKELARTLVEKTFESVKMIQLERYNNAGPEKRKNIILDPKEIFHRAVENCTPILELQKIRKGGIAYQVPVPVDEQRARFLSMNWLIKAAQEKEGGYSFYKMLAKELIEAANNGGRVVKKKQDLHKQCEANRAYAHYRWM